MLEKQPLVCVVVPIYKTEKYISKCVDSILSQTYTNLEVVLVDDGSPDRCGAICDEYAARDSRVKVIHKENEGVSVARNAGIDAAKGEYVAFVDSDDYVMPSYIERLCNAVVNDCSDMAVCNMIREEGLKREAMLKLDDCVVRGSRIYRYMKRVNRALLFPLLYGPIWRRIFKMDIIKEHNIRFTRALNVGEDEVMLCEYLQYARTVSVISDALYVYVDSDTSVSAANIGRFDPRNNEALMRRFCEEAQRSTNAPHKKWCRELYVYHCYKAIRNDKDSPLGENMETYCSILRHNLLPLMSISRGARRKAVALMRSAGPAPYRMARSVFRALKKCVHPARK